MRDWTARLSPGSENKQIVLKFPNATFEFNGADYVGKFVLPNVYFHITTAYGILRNRGVALTKGDYLGGATNGAAAETRA